MSNISRKYDTLDPHFEKINEYKLNDANFKPLEVIKSKVKDVKSKLGSKSDNIQQLEFFMSNAKPNLNNLGTIEAHLNHEIANSNMYINALRHIGLGNSDTKLNGGVAGGHEGAIVFYQNTLYKSLEPSKKYRVQVDINNNLGKNLADYLKISNESLVGGERVLEIATSFGPLAEPQRTRFNKEAESEAKATEAYTTLTFEECNTYNEKLDECPKDRCEIKDKKCENKTNSSEYDMLQSTSNTDSPVYNTLNQNINNASLINPMYDALPGPSTNKILTNPEYNTLSKVSTNKSYSVHNPPTNSCLDYKSEDNCPRSKCEWIDGKCKNLYETIRKTSGLTSNTLYVPAGNSLSNQPQNKVKKYESYNFPIDAEYVFYCKLSMLYQYAVKNNKYDFIQKFYKITTLPLLEGDYEIISPKDNNVYNENLLIDIKKDTEIGQEPKNRNYYEIGNLRHGGDTSGEWAQPLFDYKIGLYTKNQYDYNINYSETDDSIRGKVRDQLFLDINSTSNQHGFRLEGTGDESEVEKYIKNELVEAKRMGKDEGTKDEHQGGSRYKVNNTTKTKKRTNTNITKAKKLTKKRNDILQSGGSNFKSYVFGKSKYYKLRIEKNEILKEVKQLYSKLNLSYFTNTKTHLRPLFHLLHINPFLLNNKLIRQFIAAKPEKVENRSLYSIPPILTLSKMIEEIYNANSLNSYITELDKIYDCFAGKHTFVNVDKDPIFGFIGASIMISFKSGNIKKKPKEEQIGRAHV